jgi:hypothetical protein
LQQAGKHPIEFICCSRKGDEEMNTNTLYKIRIAGELPEHWFEWFDNFTINIDEEGITALEGYIIDQSALYGILARLGQLNLKILSVMQVDQKHSD